jgi:ketosteroid isomerase-like protein
MTLTALDHAEIQSLYGRYCFAIDLRDFDGYAACYTSDAAFVSYAGLVVQGRPALREFGVKAMENPDMVGYHWCSNLVLEATDYGAAGRCYLMYLAAPSDDRAEVRRALYYEDELAREDGRWLFRRREVKKQEPGARRG